jgi:hypothetical protein
MLILAPAFSSLWDIAIKHHFEHPSVASTTIANRLETTHVMMRNISSRYASERGDLNRAHKRRVWGTPEARKRNARETTRVQEASPVAPGKTPLPTRRNEHRGKATEVWVFIQ